MKNRSEILTLIAEVKGRLNELENLVQLGPDYAVPSPQAFEDPGVEDLTPRGYTQYRALGLKEKNSLALLTPLNEFVQFAAPTEDLKCDIADFLLSDLHSKDPASTYGLTLMPAGEQQDWFAFEFLCPDLDPKEWEWTDWILKISTQTPGTLFSQFILFGDGEPCFIVLGEHQVTEYATFFHFRLDRGMIPSDQVSSIRNMRLVLSTGGIMMGLSIYAFSVYGRR